MGESERRIIEQCQRRGQPLPESMLNAPTLYFGLGEYYVAFWSLHRDRPSSGFGVGQIPWSSMDRYAERHGYTDEEFERFEYLISEMDAAFISHVTPKKAD